jgi:hypothetical protein
VRPNRRSRRRRLLGLKMLEREVLYCIFRSMAGIRFWPP